MNQGYIGKKEKLHAPSEELDFRKRRKPPCGTISYDKYTFFSFAETKEEISCKRCLKRLEIEEKGENNMYSETEMKTIKFTDDISTQDRPICPECINHVQGEVGEVFDCKNEYRYEKRTGVGQCCCYSITHGINTR